MTDSIEATTAWLYRHGDCPNDKTLVGAVCYYMLWWERDRKDCMDVLALQSIDSAIELLQAMREL